MLSGNPNGYLLICANEEVSETCDNALCKSFAALGYGSNALTYLVATPAILQPTHLFQLMEAIDPGIVVAVDDMMKELILSAYRLPAAQQDPSCMHIGGRPAVLFSDMSHLMEDEAGRQLIWAALKTLPKR